MPARPRTARPPTATPSAGAAGAAGAAGVASAAGKAAVLEQGLIDDMGALSQDPLGFVRYTYPWGEPDSVLANDSGPDPWQADLLAHIGAELQAGRQLIRVAARSGHGVGKSTLAAWLIDWALSTLSDTRVVVTANTETQLRTKTSPELSKWRGLSITAPWFDSQTLSLSSTDAGHRGSWRADLIPWSETNTEAFAGLHNAGRRILLIFDEASAIADKIWEVAEGAMTDANTEIIWLAMGNPTRNSGRFFEIWNKHRALWHQVTVDTRQSTRTNQALIAQWAEIYGEDSDFFRVRVAGEFPDVGDRQFIARDIVEQAMTRAVTVVEQDPVIIGVDPARFGDDRAVIYVRHGRNARDYPIIKLPKVDHETLAARVIEVANAVFADAIIVDGGGIGGPLVDTLRAYGVSDVHEVLSQQAASDRQAHVQKDAEMWDNMRTALKDWLAIPEDDELKADLIGREYDYRRGALVLERKDAMKKRGLASPDLADALALTFAVPIQRRQPGERRLSARRFAADAGSGFDTDINDLRS